MIHLVLYSLLVLQCADGSCSVPAYQWRDLGDDESVGLYLNNQQIGVYSVRRETYWPVDTQTRTYGPPTLPPIAPPPAKWKLAGVDKSKLPQEKKFLTETGEIEEKRAMQKLNMAIPDDGDFLHVTFIDEDYDRAKRAADDFKTKEPELAKTVHVKIFDANDPLVKNAGFVTTGKPTVYIQKGRVVLGRSDTYPGAKALASAVRKSRPDYNPAKDPAISSPLNFLTAIETFFQRPLGIIIALIIAVLFLTRKPT